jgi:hypothetical protein
MCYKSYKEINRIIQSDKNQRNVALFSVTIFIKKYTSFAVKIVNLLAQNVPDSCKKFNELSILF